MASFDGVPRAAPVLAADPHFSASGRAVAVVGGTGGLGRAIARQLAARGAKVTVVGRTFRDEGVAGLTFLAADLATVAEARRVAAQLPAESLDAVVFTSGIITAPTRELTSDGVERDLAVSYLSRFVLLRELAPRLGKDRPSRPRVFVMGFPGTGELGDPEDLNADRAYRQWPQHMNTVAANEALVIDAAGRYPHLAVFGINPGLVATDIRANLQRGLLALPMWIGEGMIRLFAASPDRWAERVVPAMFAAELDRETGFHLNRKGAPIERSAGMTDERVAAFTQATEALLGRVAS